MPLKFCKIHKNCEKYHCKALLFLLFCNVSRSKNCWTFLLHTNVYTDNLISDLLLHIAGSFILQSICMNSALLFWIAVQTLPVNKFQFFSTFPVLSLATLPIFGVETVKFEVEFETSIHASVSSLNVEMKSEIIKFYLRVNKYRFHSFQIRSYRLQVGFPSLLKSLQDFLLFSRMRSELLRIWESLVHLGLLKSKILKFFCKKIFKGLSNLYIPVFVVVKKHESLSIE